MSEMIDLLNEHAPSAAMVISSITDSDTNLSSKLKSYIYKCPREWATLMKSLASTSPTCTLLHPSNSVASLVCSMREIDVTKDVVLMQRLQQEIPVIFRLVRSLAYYPLKTLSPLSKDLWTKANAPFCTVDCLDKPEDATVVNCESGVSSDLSYFPGLPKVRSQGVYIGDKKLSDIICTKRSSRHPALLPGIFTLFCEHGMCTLCSCWSIYYNIWIL